MTKKENKQYTKRKVRRTEKSLRDEAPMQDATLGRASRRLWGGGKAKT